MVFNYTILTKKLLNIPCLCFVFFAILCTGCHSASKIEKDKITIKLSKDSQLIVVSGLEYAALAELKQDSLTTENFHELFPVYRMPADTDMKDCQKPQLGSYQVSDNGITFKPDTAFKKHQQYFARFYGHTTHNS